MSKTRTGGKVAGEFLPMQRKVADKAKAPADGRYHAVSRRGMWYVEITYSDPDLVSVYAQVGALYRTRTDSLSALNHVFGLDQQTAVDITETLNRTIALTEMREAAQRKRVQNRDAKAKPKPKSKRK